MNLEPEKTKPENSSDETDGEVFHFGPGPIYEDESDYDGSNVFGPD